MDDNEYYQLRRSPNILLKNVVIDRTWKMSTLRKTGGQKGKGFS